MEQYTQITIDMWMQWKEDIARKLRDTQENFVYIGYRLRQIRDSGMLDGAADIFEFASREFNLSKSTTSRFIAVNEKFSDPRNPLRLHPDFERMGSSKLSEMLTLSDAECLLITEKTTIREIRELKSFSRQQPSEEPDPDEERTPLEKCIIDYFRDKKEMLEEVMRSLDEEMPAYKDAAEAMNPSGQASHRKGIVFLFLYEWPDGVKYKMMMQPEPIALTWPDFLNMVYEIYSGYDQKDVWTSFYREEQEAVLTQSNQGIESVATSQRTLDTEEDCEERSKSREQPEERTEEQLEKPPERTMERPEAAAVRDTAEEGPYREEQEAGPAQSNQGTEPVATSQQTPDIEKNHGEKSEREEQPGTATVEESAERKIIRRCWGIEETTEDLRKDVERKDWKKVEEAAMRIERQAIQIAKIAEQKQ